MAAAAAAAAAAATAAAANAAAEQRKREFLFSHLGWRNDPEAWVGVKFLGEGTGGRAGLWCRQDARGRIVDRMACKESTMNYRMRSYGPGNSIWEPREVWMHRMISRQDPRNNMVSYLGHRMYPLLPDNGQNMTHRPWRLYMEYCEHGDLKTYYNAHFEKVRVRGRLRRRVVPGAHVPEPVLWAIFKQLADGCWSFHQMRDSSRAQVRDFVHHDIKLENIFLATPDEFAEYPKPKFGDFGGALATWWHDPLNPGGFRGLPATPGYMAAENYFWHPMGIHITNALNIFQIGMIMRTLMRLDDNEPQLDWSQNPLPSRRFPINNTPVRYSKDLKDMVRWCIRYNHQYRAGSWPLRVHLGDAARYEARYQRRMAGGARTRRFAPAQPWRGRLEDQYRKGLSMHGRMRFDLRRRVPRLPLPEVQDHVNAPGGGVLRSQEIREHYNQMMNRMGRQRDVTDALAHANPA